MKYLEDLKEKLCKSLDELSKKGDMSIADLEKIHVLTDSVKNIGKIKMLEEQSGYSEEGSSYARGRGRYARRDSMGRYSYDMGANYSEDENRYSEGSSYRGYSRHDAKDHMMMKLGAMMEEADPKMRESLKKCMRDIEEM